MTMCNRLIEGGTCLLLLLLLLLSVVNSSKPTTSHVETVKLEAVGQIGGTISALFSVDEIVYLSLGSRLLILDMSEPAQPKELGQILLQSTMIRDIVVADNLAYLVSEDGALHIVDVSQPTKPVLMSSIIFSGRGYMVTLVGSIAYVALGEAGVRVVDISQPNAPQDVTTIPVKSLKSSYDIAQGVGVVGNYAYFLGWDVLYIYDISSPATPVDVGVVDIGSAERMRVQDNYLFIMSSAIFWILDLSTPDKPSEIVRYYKYDARFISDATIHQDKLYLVHNDGLEVLSLGPDGLTELAFLPVAMSVNRIDIPAHVSVGMGNQLYLTDAHDGLLVVDVSMPTSPRAIGSYETLGPVRGVRVQDGIAILEVYKQLSSFTSRRENDDFWAVDVSVPSSPQVVGRQRTSTWPDTAIISESEVAYAPSYGYGLRILDISDPNNIDNVAVVLPKSSVKEIVVQGNYAYAIGRPLYVLDITTPKAPTLLSGYRFNPIPPRQMHWFETTGIAVSNDLAFLTYQHCYQDQCNDRGMQIVDVSYRWWPKWVAQYKPKGPAPQDLRNDGGPTYTQGVDIEGELAYVAGGDEGLRVVDISEPTTPVEVGYYNTPDIAWDVEVVDGYIYVTTGDAGVLILQIIEQ